VSAQIDLNQPFAAFAFHALAEYAKEVPGGKLTRNMWLDELDRAHTAWHAHRDEKKPKRKAKEASTSAEAIYALYPRKIGREAALRAIGKALEKVSYDRLEEATKLYASTVSRYKAEDRSFVPHPSTWFNDGRWLDDPKEWERPGMEPPRRPAVVQTPEPPYWLDFMKRNSPDWIRLREDCLPTWNGLFPYERATVLELMAKGVNA
jgi:hypothetical protein